MCIRKLGSFGAIVFLLITSPLLAQNATIAGTATGPNGQPVRNTEVRIQRENSKSPALVARTDSHGRFVVKGVPVGNYSVVLVNNGVVKSSTERVKAEANKTVQVNFTAAASPARLAAASKDRRSVYGHPPTGSHMGGYSNRGKNRDNVDAMSSEELRRLQNTQIPERGN